MIVECLVSKEPSGKSSDLMKNLSVATIQLCDLEQEIEPS